MGVTGLEPVTARLSAVCSTTELYSLAPQVGLEPTTAELEVPCSKSTELLRHIRRAGIEPTILRIA